MKPKTMILMGLAIVCGLGASYMTSRLLAERQAPEEEKVKILVAKRNMSVGQPLLKPEELFEFKEVSKENEPPDAIKDYDALKGKIMKQSRNKGDHIVEANLRDNRAGLDIPVGYKAIGLRVNLEGSASGFATLPQSRVDVIQTVRGPDAKASYSRFLLENVLVLAADLRLSPDGELASPAQVVTFALKNEDLLKVNLAKELGILSLSLRKLNDESISDTEKITGDKLGRNEEKETPPVVVAEAPKPVEPKVVPEVKPEAPKVKTGHYDIVNGSESGPRSVTRVQYEEAEDGTITITGQSLIESTNPRQRPATGTPKSGGRQERDL
jgi:pilus assembly protein CpaB